MICITCILESHTKKVNKKKCENHRLDSRMYSTGQSAILLNSCNRLEMNFPESLLIMGNC